MMRNRILEFPVTTMMTVLGIAVGLIILTFCIIGLFGGALKEVFYYINTSQGPSIKTTSFDSDPVLVTQE